MQCNMLVIIYLLLSELSYFLYLFAETGWQIKVLPPQVNSMAESEYSVCTNGR